MRKELASLGIGIGIELVLAMLSQLGIPIPELWLYVGLGIGALFIGLGILGFIWPKRTNRDIPSQSATSELGSITQSVVQGDRATININQDQERQNIAPYLDMEILNIERNNLISWAPVGAFPDSPGSTLQVDVTFRPNQPMQLARIVARWDLHITELRKLPTNYLHGPEFYTLYFPVGRSAPSGIPVRLCVLAAGEWWDSPTFIMP